MESSLIDDRVRGIFSATDKNADSGLDEAEVAWLVRQCNPEAILDEEQIGLIVKEIWASYAEHIGPQGLTVQGLSSIYTSGLADAERDFQLVCGGSKLLPNVSITSSKVSSRIPMAPASGAKSMASFSAFSNSKISALGKPSRIGSGLADDAVEPTANSDLIASVRKPQVTRSNENKSMSPTIERPNAATSPVRPSPSPPRSPSRTPAVFRGSSWSVLDSTPIDLRASTFHPLATPGPTPWTLGLSGGKSNAAVPSVLSEELIPTQGENSIPLQEQQPLQRQSMLQDDSEQNFQGIVNPESSLNDEIPRSLGKEEEHETTPGVTMEQPSPKTEQGLQEEPSEISSDPAADIFASVVTPAPVQLRGVPSVVGFTPGSALLRSIRRTGRRNTTAKSNQTKQTTRLPIRLALPDLSQAEFSPSKLQEALQMSAPEGSAVEISETTSEQNSGMIVSACICFEQDDFFDPEAAMEEFKYLMTVLRIEPAQVLDPGVFGRVRLLPNEPAKQADGTKGDTTSMNEQKTGPGVEISPIGSELGQNDNKRETHGTQEHSMAVTTDVFEGLQTVCKPVARTQEVSLGTPGALHQSEQVARATVVVPGAHPRDWTMPRVERQGALRFLGSGKKVRHPSRQELMLASLRKTLPEGSIVQVGMPTPVSRYTNTQLELRLTIQTPTHISSSATEDRKGVIERAIRGALPTESRLVTLAFSQDSPPLSTRQSTRGGGSDPPSDSRCTQVINDAELKGSAVAAGAVGEGEGSEADGLATDQSCLLQQGSHSAAVQSCEGSVSLARSLSSRVELETETVDQELQLEASTTVEQQENLPASDNGTKADPNTSNNNRSSPSLEIFASSGAVIQQQLRSPGAIEKEFLAELRSLLELGVADEAPELRRLQARARSLSGHHPPAELSALHMKMGRALAQAARHASSLRSFEDAISLDAGNALAHFRAGNALFSRRQYRAAAARYRTCLEVTRCRSPGRGADSSDNLPLQVKTYVNLGISLEADGLLLAACDDYRHAAELDPTHFRAFKLLGSALYAVGDFGGAKSALKSALRLKPGYADAHCDLGCVYCALGANSQAKKHFENAIACDPWHLEAHFNRGNLLRQGGDLHGAIESYDKVLTAEPSHWRSLLNKAVVQTCLGGSKEEAAANLRLALKLSGQTSVLQQEVDQLKRMLKQGAAWESVSQMMSFISDRAAQVESSARVAGSRAIQCEDKGAKVSTASPVTSRLLRNLTPSKMMMAGRGTSMISAANKNGPEEAATRPLDMKALAAELDIPVLQQLAPLARIQPRDLIAELDHMSGGSSLVRMPEAEALLRQALPEVPAALFQHMMRTFHSQVLVRLAEGMAEPRVDARTLCMLVSALSSEASLTERLAVAYRLSMRCSQPVTRRDAQRYASLLCLTFSSSHSDDQEHLSSSESRGVADEALDKHGFHDAVCAAFPAIDVLPVLCQSPRHVTSAGP